MNWPVCSARGLIYKIQLRWPMGWQNIIVTALCVLQLTATAIPEPGTYVALAGLVALSLAAFRRRRPAQPE